MEKVSILSHKPIIYNWQTHHQAETDIILEMDSIFCPVEIKTKKQPIRLEYGDVIHSTNIIPVEKFKGIKILRVCQELQKNLRLNKKRLKNNYGWGDDYRTAVSLHPVNIDLTIVA
jgi:hypothetical protein